MNETQKELLQYQSDHDILITLVEKVSSNHATLLDKFDRLSKDMNDLRNSTKSDNTAMTHRIDKLEDSLGKYNFQEWYSTCKADHEWNTDFRKTWKLVVVAISACSMVLGGIIDRGLDVMGLFGKVK
ncbi:MAG TPA: hypothetical protein VH186_06195 [Chloroflexia bacterium]|nr:hypothetical protein [Chloroflexia bacterium]